jgi:hypothetical protein
MSTKNKKSSATGVRYTDAQKKEVVDFVSQYNSKNGRGGQSSASSKFKVTPLTISAWIKASGAPAPAKKGAKAAPVKAAKAAKAAKAPKAPKAPKAAKAPKAPKAAKAPKAPKAAKPAKAGKGVRGVRYTPEEKKVVVDFVSDFNATNGRGGQSQAVEKFKLSAITVASWLKAAGVKTGKGATKTKPAVKAANAVKSVKAAPAGLAAKVAALVDLNDQVSKAEAELEKLYSKHDAIMASLKGAI